MNILLRKIPYLKYLIGFIVVSYLAVSFFPALGAPGDPGTIDTTFNTGTGLTGGDGGFAVDLDSNGKIIVGGNFTSFNGSPRYSITRLNIDGSVDLAFTNATTGFTLSSGVAGSGFVYDLAIDSSDRIIAVGNFIRYDNVLSRRIARLNTDGTLDETFIQGTSFNGIALAVDLDSNGKIIVGGGFTQYNGTTTNYIARLNTDGTLDGTFNIGTGFNGNVYALAVDSSDGVIAWGQFSSYNGTTTTSFVRLNSDGSLDLSFNPNNATFSNASEVLIDSSDRIYVSGGLFSYNGTSTINNVVRFDSSGVLDTSYVSYQADGANSDIEAMAIDSEGRVILLGEFVNYNDGPTSYDANGILRLQASGEFDETFDSTVGFNDVTAGALAIDSSDRVIAVGDFLTYNGVMAVNITRINGGTLSPSVSPSSGPTYSLPPQCHLAAPESISEGSDASLSWYVTWPGEQSLYWYNLHDNRPGISDYERTYSSEETGVVVPGIAEETEFTLEAINQWGATFCTETITIDQPEPEIIPDALSCSLQATPPTPPNAYVGDEVILSWGIQGGVAPYTGPDGEQISSPQILVIEEEGPFEFQLDVMDAEGAEATCVTDLTVLPVEPPQPEDYPPLTCEAFASPSVITEEGMSTDITWSINGGKSPYLSYFNSEGYPVLPPYTVTPSDHSVYSIYIKDSLESTTQCYVGVTVNTEDPLVIDEIAGCMDPQALNYNSQATQSNSSCVYQQTEDPITTGGTNDSSLIIYPDDTDLDSVPEPETEGPVEVLPPQLPESVTFRTVDLANFVEKKEAKIGVAVALAVGIITAMANAFATPLSGSELVLLPARLWNLLLTALGIRKKDRPWGTVYDSRTKQPLDPVHVVLTNIQTGVEQTAITDMDGRYSFIVDTPGTYRLTANKAQYLFPSVLLAGQSQDHLYQDLYHGEPFQITEGGQVITKNIPLDAQESNWNEADKLKNNRLKFYKKRDYLLTKIADILFYVGFVVAVLALVFFPQPYNIATFALYTLFALIKKTGYGGRPTGDVTDQQGNPVPHAILRLISPTLNQEIKHAVADKYGRYHLLANNGDYNLKVEERQNEEIVKERTQSVKIKKGYYKEDISL